MLSFAGIPLTSGFIGKWAVFAAAWSGGVQWLVVVAVVISVVAAFFYIRVIVLMFLPTEENGDQRSASQLDHADGRRCRCSRDGSLRGISGPAVGAGPASR